MSKIDWSLSGACTLLGVAIGGSLFSFVFDRPIEVQCSVTAPAPCPEDDRGGEELLSGLDLGTVKTIRTAADGGLDRAQATDLLAQLAQTRAAGIIAAKNHADCEGRSLGPVR